MNPVVFFDLDGVLADFVRGSFRLHGRSVPICEVRWDFCSQIGFSGAADPAFWAPMGREFWRGLDVLEDGFSLLRHVELMLMRSQIAILTSGALTDGCLDGKRDWVKQHLPEYFPRTFFGSAKELFAGPGKVLVDDNDANVSRFRAAGGLAVLIPRPWNARADECGSDGSFSGAALAEDLRGVIRKAA